jgi:tetratricopeptide (TPR) repeat protein
MKTDRASGTRFFFFKIRIFFFIILAGAVFFSYQVQRKIESIPLYRSPETLLYLPSGKYLKPLMLGFNQLAADFLWLKVVTYFGGHYLTDKNFSWLYRILDLTTTLDPYFRLPYEFGGIVLSVEKGDIDQSNALLKKGIQYHPDYWRLPFYLGFNYFFYLKDPETAAGYISRAASLPGHPPYLPKLAASLYAGAGHKDIALDFLIQIYRNTDDPALKENLLQKITALQEGKLPSSLAKTLGAEHTPHTGQ